MDRKTLIKKYIEYFISKNHKEISNASLIPKNDPTVLFTTAGMHPLVPFLSGQKHPQGKRLVNVQKCIRTGDIEEVGDSHHHTFFEMLGNWSLGDYWKKEAIEMTFEFLTKELGIPKEKLSITCFKGEGNIPEDSESEKIWKNFGIKKIKFLGKKDNWWGPAGKTGPCGPDTEVFVCGVEIGNNVLMEYVKDENGKYIDAKQKNIDFGGGVERTVAVLNGLNDNYLADMWKPIIGKIEMISRHKYDEEEKTTKAMRIIADHIKAAVFIINDGVTPSNTEQGYVLRRLIRRAIRFGRVIGIELFTTKIADVIYELYDDYKFKTETISLELQKEEEKFLRTLEQGLRIFEKVISNKKVLAGEDAFLLYQSYGFPIEMTKELAEERKIKLDEKGYYEALNNHQELSRTSTEGKFKSGLADNSEATTRLHTATHLLLAAMNKILEKPKGMSEIEQRGSNITGERARFDFSYDRKLTDEEVEKIEALVNDWIKTGGDVLVKEMTLNEARKFGASGIFEDKYKKVKKLSVYTIDNGNISKEICTGPHVNSLKELQGLGFRITKQKSVGAGVRRVRIELI